MDDPYEAAEALRKHARIYGLKLNEYLQIGPGQLPEIMHKKQLRKQDFNRIHVFNGEEFIPLPGIDHDLSEIVASLKNEAKESEKIVCILQIQNDLTVDNFLKMLESGVKIYTSVGRTSFIARLPANMIEKLNTYFFIRWIGLYKPEYKYNPVPSNSEKLGAFIYPLGGDKPEYRHDLQEFGLEIRGYDKAANFYDVICDNSLFKDIAHNFWWVKGISKEPSEELLAYEPDDSREIISSFKTGFTGDGINVGIRDTGIWTGNSLDFPNGSIYSLGGDWGDEHGHGTHVSGIIGSRGISNLNCLYNGSGVAPAVTLYVASGLLGYGGGYSYSEAFTYFSNNDVQISNHSWVFPGNYSYDPDTEAHLRQ